MLYEPKDIFNCPTGSGSGWDGHAVSFLLFAVFT
jgi:hypothetical protein